MFAQASAILDHDCRSLQSDFWLGSPWDTASRSDLNEFIKTSAKSQPEMECFIRLACDWLYSPDPLHIKWRFQNFKSLMPMLKTSPFDWLNYHVSL